MARGGARRQWLGPSLVCAPVLFAPGARIDLGPSMRAVTETANRLPGLAVDIECQVGRFHPVSATLRPAN
ncbi:MAG: hypothetical protein JSR47_00670 [Proteobacteria bacterium]|nr:hypothetical protein [Pseudomonadota bacterium]